MTPQTDRPNVLIVIMDDLAYGDLACHGNPYTQTAHLDRLRDQSTRLSHYCSGPVCTPARAALMTGRYPYRTRAIDTYCGRSMIDPDEITLAERLRDAGYATCISGKWHLGDCYPVRAMDQGFGEALVHNGGGLSQPGNFGRDDYFDPQLMHNGRLIDSRGYCTDLFTDHCIDFISNHRAERWFCYLGTNAPHTPLIVADEWAERYRELGLPEPWAKLYGMVDNIDMNVGRVLGALDEMNLADDTLVIYTSDHGPCGSAHADGRSRFNADLRGIKGSEFQGGVKAPCFWRWPGRFAAGRDLDRLANPIDFLPTLGAACGFAPPTGLTIDGVNLLPLLTGETDEADWPDRTVFLQWHRGDLPERFRNAAAIGQRYKWYRPGGVRPDEPIGDPQLFDLQADPLEQHDLAADQPDLAARMQAEYERWFDDVSSTRGDTPADNYMCPNIIAGTAHENPTVLTQQDGRLYGGAPEGWGVDHPMWWQVELPKAQAFDIRVNLPGELHGEATLTLRWQHVEQSINVTGEMDHHTFENTELPAGAGRFEATLTQGDRRLCARNVFLTSRAQPVNTL